MSESLRLAVILTLSGGFMDAYSYMCRGNVFANAQTGNILLLGVNLSTGNFTKALYYLCPILAFTVGIAVSDIIRHYFKDSKTIHWRQITVIGEVLILLAVAFISKDLNLLANSLTSFACGAQVESFRKFEGVSAATTMCIGNLRTGTQLVCDYCFHKNTTNLRKGLMIYVIIMTFVAGAVIGNFCVIKMGTYAITVSSALMFCAFLMMFAGGE